MTSMPIEQAFLADKDHGPAFWNVDILWVVLADGSQTGGQYSLMWELCPRGSGPPPHYHDQDEQFYVVSGQITYRAGEQTLVATAGAFVLIPKGTVHSFRVDSETAEILNSYTPAGFERTILELAEPAATRTLPPPGRPMTKDWEQVSALFAEVGMHVVQQPDVLRAQGDARQAPPTSHPTEESQPMSTPAPFRFEGLSLPVSDVNRTVAFYRDLLGVTVQQQHGKSFALLRIGAGTIGLIKAEISDAGTMANLTPEARSAIHVEFSTDDLDGLYATLMARGVVFHEPPHDEPWERAMATHDPDGYTVEFAQGHRGDNAPERTPR